MRTRDVMLAATLVAALAGGCRKSETPSASPSEAPAAEGAPAGDEAPAAEAAPQAVAPPPAAHAQGTPAAPAEMTILAIMLGPNPEEGGGLDRGIFPVGQEVVASLDASALPFGAIVKVTWSAADGSPRGEENKPSQGVGRWLSFTAPGSSGWPEGQYRVEFQVSTGGYASATFQVGHPADVPTVQPGP